MILCDDIKMYNRLRIVFSVYNKHDVYFYKHNVLIYFKIIRLQNTKGTIYVERENRAD